MNVEKNNDLYKIFFSKDELVVLHQLFNEALNGLKIEPFEKKIGEGREVQNIMKRLRDVWENQKKEETDHELMIPFSKEEILLCKNVIREVCEEIEDWEFSTRVAGLPKSFAQGILNDLERLCI